MFHKRIARAAIGVLLAAGAAVTVMAAPAQASTSASAPAQASASTSASASASAPAQASAGPVGVASGCRFQLAKVIGHELQESAGDEIYLRIGDEYTARVGFKEEEDVHNGTDFGNFEQISESIPAGGRISVGVAEWDWPGGDELLGSFFVTCTVGHFSNTVTGFGSQYEIVYDVVQI